MLEEWLSNRLWCVLIMTECTLKSKMKEQRGDNALLRARKGKKHLFEAENKSERTSYTFVMENSYKVWT